MKRIATGLLFDVKRLGADELGATSIEYALIAGGISIAIAGVAGSIGDILVDDYYTRVLEALESANDSGS